MTKPGHQRDWGGIGGGVGWRMSCGGVMFLTNFLSASPSLGTLSYKSTLLGSID